METTPFDIPQEEPKLPQGDSHIPPRSYFNIADPLPRPTEEQVAARRAEDDARNSALRSAPSEAHMMEISHLSEKDQELIFHWWPQVFFRPSKFIDMPVVCNVQQVLVHAKGMRKEGYKIPKPDTTGHTVATSDSFAQAHMAWIAECTARKKWIESKKEEWQRRKTERDAALADMKRQWDPYVNEAHKAFKDADAYPIPERPVRT